MNKVILTGYIASDLEVLYSASGTARLPFLLAVPCKKSSNSDKTTNFINCVCFGKNAENIDRYFSKGKAITVSEGEISVNKIDKKKYFNVIVHAWEFPIVSKLDAIEQKKELNSSSQENDDFDIDIINDDEDEDEEMPW